MILHTLRRYLLGLLALLFAAVGFIVAVLVVTEIQLPNVDVLKDIRMQVPLRVYSREGELLGEYGDKRRIPVTLEEVPKLLVQGILATEDQRFYSHSGVDFISLFRAIKVVAGTGEKSQGASTITMQVARNFFLDSKKTYVRKFREILLALKIERTFGKDKILELYLNKVYFGNRAYGVAAAASVYYGKSLDQLTLAEMAMIAGLPQAPSKNNPLVRSKEALERRNHVLLRMLGVGDITKAQYQQAIHEPDTASYHGPQMGVNAPYIGEMVRQYMVQQYGPEVYEQGYSVYTTVAAAMQSAAKRALQNGLLTYTQRHGYYSSKKTLSQKDANWQLVWKKELTAMSLADNPLRPAGVLSVADGNIQAILANGRTVSIPLINGANVRLGDVIWVSPVGDGWRLESLPQVQGAVVAMDPQNGAILALVGGYDFESSEFNRATQAQRQPGSAFKPFIYSAALDKGFTLASTINDAPIVIRDSGANSEWRPHNSSELFYGPTRLREALIWSRNMVSIRLLQAIGIDYAVDYAKRFGFDAAQLPHSLSLALGTNLATPLTMTTAYSVFANGGYLVTPYFIDHIVSQDNQTVFTAHPAQACAAECPADQLAPQVIDPQNAYLMTQVLQDVIVHGTGQAALVLKRSDLAGKTGTTNDKNNDETDAWFIGFTSKIVTSVWVGYDDLRATHEYAAQAAFPIWIDFMRTALAGLPVSTMQQPPGIVSARIDQHTGLLAGPNQADTLFEVFRQGYEPHDQAPADSAPSSSSTATNGGSDNSSGDGGIF